MNYSSMFFLGNYVCYINRFFVKFLLFNVFNGVMREVVNSVLNFEFLWNILI